MTGKCLCPLKAEAPLVSVVVPNYNHAEFLKRRLDSIYGQTYDDFEVILLDDASTDGSRDILRAYTTEYAGRTRLITNEKNSGSPFAQWAKGIEAARGQLIWMAESDDYCGVDFLARLVKPFNDENVVLAFTAPTYVDRQGRETSYQFRLYTDGVSRHKWDAPYCVAAEQEVAEALGLRNTIPNASAALFRRAAALPHLNDPIWRSMRILGDWCFYLRIIRGGKVAFLKDVKTYFTHTPQNTSAADSRTSRLLAEHAYLVGILLLLYPHIGISELNKNYGFVEDHLRWLFPEDLPPFALAWHGVPLGERDRLNRELSQQSNDLACILASLSWKITGPLRLAKSTLQKLAAGAAVK